MRSKFPVISKICSSTLSRASQTAEVIRGEYDAVGDIEKFSDLREQNWGITNGWLLADKIKSYPNLQTPPGGETGEQARSRFTRSIVEIGSHHSGETVIIATHSASMKLLVNDIFARKGSAQRKESLDCGEAVVVKFDGKELHFDSYLKV